MALTACRAHIEPMFTIAPPFIRLLDELETLQQEFNAESATPTG